MAIRAAIGVSVLAAGMLLGVRAAEDPRVRAMQEEIRRLKAEADLLKSQASGLLGEIERIDARIRLRRAELDHVSLRLTSTAETLAARERELGRLASAQSQRRAYLAFRVREIYKRGELGLLPRLLGGEDAAAALDGIRYAAVLGERDARLLRAFREDTRLVEAEQSALRAERDRLVALRAEAATAAAALESSRASRAKLLGGIQEDRAQRLTALGELEAAARSLSDLVREVGGRVRGSPPLDVRKFRGVLDWPAAGPVAVPFGSAIHPRFKTAVPHPGLDIDAPAGSDIRAVFDGRVAFARSLHGYGLTAIVDHGGEVVSVYTHAAVLLVGEGDAVSRGQVLGKVGDSGSMRGPYLYFEMREGGKAVDPLGWLRKR